MDNFKIIYRILRYFEKAMDYEETDLRFVSVEALSISERRWILIMGMLKQDGYISGVEVTRTADRGAVISISNPMITLKGLEYLQKAARLAKGIVDLAI